MTQTLRSDSIQQYYYRTIPDLSQKQFLNEQYSLLLSLDCKGLGNGNSLDALQKDAFVRRV